MPADPKETTISKILCPFCSAPWSEENIRVWNIDSADQCDSGRYDPPTYSISISCHACGREMYRKEGAYTENG
jgi:hypothetical protein